MTAAVIEGLRMKSCQNDPYSDARNVAPTPASRFSMGTRVPRHSRPLRKVKTSWVVALLPSINRTGPVGPVTIGGDTPAWWLPHENPAPPHVAGR